MVEHKESSRILNLTYATPDSFILRADYTTVLDAGDAGRNSVRIMTQNSYTTHVAVFDIRHMPEGCGTWPAIWETKPTDWPTGGEVDIVEGVYGKSPNLASLHTTPGCTMPANRTQTGTSASNNCEGGCNVQFPMAESFGSSFNANGGGWFALERRTDLIKIWFWDRKGKNVPPSIREGMVKLYTDSWGTPVAYFPNTTCDMTKHFTDHHIILNLNLCGDWASPTYPSTGCPLTCTDFVNRHPEHFKDAYFDIASIRIYEQAPQ